MADSTPAPGSPSPSTIAHELSLARDGAEVTAIAHRLEAALAAERAARAAAEVAAGRARFLAEVGGLVAGSLDADLTLARLAETAVPFLADVCIVDLVEPGGGWRRAAIAHVDATGAAALRADAEDLARVAPAESPTVMSVDQAPAVHAASRERLHRLGWRSMLVAPIPGPGRLAGALTLGLAGGERRFEPDDVTLAGTVANLAAAAAENAQLYRQAQAARLDAEAASRAKDEFLATLSHELRTPLTSILGWAHILRMGQGDGGVVAKACDTITRNAHAQIQLIDDLLDMSRVVSGKMRIAPQAVDLGRVVRNALDAIEPATAARSIEVRVDLGAPRFMVSGDPERLQQVVWNLVNNAARFTPRGGRIDIALRRRGDAAEITVADTGQGIAPDVLPHIFDRLRQGDSSTSRAHGGLGIGLALVRHLVELHGGTVTAASPGVNRGAAFTIHLPLAAIVEAPGMPTADAREPARGEPSAPRRPLEGLRVLVVDDDADSRDVLAAMLAGAGASVRACATPADGLAVLAAWRPHAVLSDIEMPGEDGYAFLAGVRGLVAAGASGTPVAALTAYARPRDRERALAAGFDTYLSKPVMPAHLVAAVAALARSAG